MQTCTGGERVTRERATLVLPPKDFQINLFKKKKNKIKGGIWQHVSIPGKNTAQTKPHFPVCHWFAGFAAINRCIVWEPLQVRLRSSPRAAVTHHPVSLDYVSHLLPAPVSAPPPPPPPPPTPRTTTLKPPAQAQQPQPVEWLHPTSFICKIVGGIERQAVSKLYVIFFYFLNTISLIFLEQLFYYFVSGTADFELFRYHFSREFYSWKEGEKKSLKTLCY